MKKTFLKSVMAGIFGIALTASCSNTTKKETNFCGAENGCAAATVDDQNQKVVKDSKQKNQTKKSKNRQK